MKLCQSTAQIVRLFRMSHQNAIGHYMSSREKSFVMDNNNSNSNRGRGTAGAGRDVQRQKDDSRNVNRNQLKEGHNVAQFGERPDIRQVEAGGPAQRHKRPWHLDREKLKEHRRTQDSMAAEAATLIQQAYQQVLRVKK